MNVFTCYDIAIHKGDLPGANSSGKISIVLHDAYMRHWALDSNARDDAYMRHRALKGTNGGCLCNRGEFDYVIPFHLNVVYNPVYCKLDMYIGLMSRFLYFNPIITLCSLLCHIQMVNYFKFKLD